MPLYIRDDAVDDLAKAVMKATGAASKTEAVRVALAEKLDAATNVQSLREFLDEAWIKIETLGEVDPTFDQKKFSDDMWDDANVY
jgi:antitoxin VapB